MTASVRAQTAPIYKRYEREPLRAAHMPARVLALLKKPPSGGLGSGAGAAAAQGQAGKEGGGEAEKDKRKEEEAEYHAARRRANRTREQEWDYVRKVGPPRCPYRVCRLRLSSPPQIKHEASSIIGPRSCEGEVCWFRAWCITIVFCGPMTRSLLTIARESTLQEQTQTPIKLRVKDTNTLLNKTHMHA
jgi:hypothetical protein